MKPISTALNRRAGSALSAVSVQMLIYTIFSNFSNLSYSPLAVFIQPDFHITSVQLGLITSSIFIGSMTIYFFVGILVDRLGPRTAIRISFAFISTGSVIAVFSSSYYQLIAAYYMIGLGYGIMTPSTNSAIMDAYYPNHATAMGIKQAGVPVGAALSALILPAIVFRFSLKYAFLTMAVVSIALMILAGRDRSRKSLGSVNFTSYLREMFHLILTDRVLIAISLTTASLSWGQQTLITYYAVFMHSIGYEKYIAVILLFVILVGAIFGRIFWIRFGERVFGTNRVSVLTLITLLSGILVLVFPYLSANLYDAIPVAFLLGMNVVAWNSMYVTVISEMAPHEKIGLYSGISMLFLGLGTILGTPFTGYVRDYTGSYYDMWLVLGSGILIASLIFATLVQKMYAGASSQRSKG